MDEISKVQPKKGQIKIYISWVEYISLVKQLARKLDHTRYTSIAGIPRGGLIPAVILSHQLKIPMVDLVNVNSNTLIVDDICDSGETLSNLNPTCDVAVLHLRYNSKYKPKFYVEELKDDTWQIYPYEQVEAENGSLQDYS